MKKKIYALLVLLNLVSVAAFSQVFWTESFNTGLCNQGTFASGSAPTATNGAWGVTSLAAPFSNGAQANEWYISAAEQGTTVGSCGISCGGGNDNTLHLGTTFPVNDLGAAYLANGGTANTNKRAESPFINCTGKSGIQFSFKYLANGIPGTDFCEVMYFDGTIWNSLGILGPAVGACAPQGMWTFTAFGLPSSADNNPGVKVGFRWQSSDPVGSDPSVAVDDIEMAVPCIATETLIPCPSYTTSAGICAAVPGITSYTWVSIPPTVTFTPNNTTIPAIVQYPTNGTYTIYLVGSTSPTSAPTTTGQTIVTVNSNITLTVTPMNQTVCPTTNATITAAGANNYTWSVVGGPVIGTASDVVVTAPTQTVMNYVVQGEYSGCLSNSVLSTVTYSNIPFTIPVTPTSLTVCPSAAFSATANGSSTYTWAVPGNPTLTPTGAVITDTPAASGIYTVTGNLGGCTGTGTLDVSVQNIPINLTITASSNTMCSGESVTLTASGANSYTWIPPATLSSSVGVSVVASPTVTTVYNVTGESGGCVGNTQVTVAIAPGPNLTINKTANAVCTGYTSTITAQGAMSYTWTGTTFTGAIVQPSISVGSGDYTVVATSTAFGCPTMSAITINTLAPLNINVVQSSFTTCIANNTPKFSKPVTLFATGGSAYNWAPCLGGHLSICIGPTVIARPQTTTQYTVTGFTSVCSGSFVVTVTVVPQTTIAVVPPSPIACLGGCFNFTVVNTTTTLPQPYTYSWTAPNEGPLSMDNNLSPHPTVCPTVTSTYSVEMKDARNCVTEQRLVTTSIIPQPLTAAQIPTINGVPTNSLCFVGDIVDITTNTLTLCAVNINPTLMAGVVPTYTWIANITPTNSLNNDGSIITPTSNACIIITPPTKLPSIRTYTIRSSFNGNGGQDNIAGCYREDTISVRVVDCRRVTAVTFTTTSPNDTICTKQCMTFTNTTDAGEPQYVKWTFPGGAPNTSTLQAPTVCFNLPGCFNVILQVDNDFGPAVQTGTFCFAKVVDVPNTTIIPPGMTMSDTTIRFGTSVDLQASGATSYIWSPPYKITNLTGPKTTVSPHQTTQYIVQGFNSNGCSSNDTINVIVIEDCGEMFVPNAFSPNGQDNLENETLKVYGYCLETLTFQVFNRWGQKVFETTDQSVGWDGTFNGEDLNTGVYVYRVEGKGFDGKGYSMKGNVTLIR